MERLQNCQEATLASAFFTTAAFQVIEPALLTALANGTKATFLLGRLDFVTEPKAIYSLLRLRAKYPHQINVFFDYDFNFHYKLAVFKARTPVVIIGSSNLTPKGLKATGEVNLEIVGNQRVYRHAYELLEERLKSADPADEHIREYEKRFNRAKKYRRQHRRWERYGQRTWRTHSQRRPASEPAGNQFTFCRIGRYEDDKKLERNIRKAHTAAQKPGESFPYQWVHIQVGRSPLSGKSDICRQGRFGSQFWLCSLH